jgi:hypothetical protein
VCRWKLYAFTSHKRVALDPGSIVGECAAVLGGGDGGGSMAQAQADASALAVPWGERQAAAVRAGAGAAAAAPPHIVAHSVECSELFCARPAAVRTVLAAYPLHAAQYRLAVRGRAHQRALRAPGQAPTDVHQFHNGGGADGGGGGGGSAAVRAALRRNSVGGVSDAGYSPPLPDAALQAALLDDAGEGGGGDGAVVVGTVVGAGEGEVSDGGGAVKALTEVVAAQDKQIQLMADQIALLKRAALQ